MVNVNLLAENAFGYLASIIECVRLIMYFRFSANRTRLQYYETCSVAKITEIRTPGRCEVNVRRSTNIFFCNRESNSYWIDHTLLFFHLTPNVEPQKHATPFPRHWNGRRIGHFLPLGVYAFSRSVDFHLSCRINFQYHSNNFPSIFIVSYLFA